MAALAVYAIASTVTHPLLQFSVLAIGNRLLSRSKAQHVHGPRLGDLQVQSSAYGETIPIVYGTVRIAGNVIWSTNIRETAHTQRVGGKGGGPKQTQTTYTYSVSLAVALCEGPIIGIRRVWTDGKLIYHVSPDADIETVIASSRNAAGMRVYLGDETQMPDPTIEAHMGVGNVPAYRGLAYVVFDNFQLGDYGNRVPNFSFEVVRAGHPSTAPLQLVTHRAYDQPQFSGFGDRLALLSADGVLRATHIDTNVVRVYGLDGRFLGTDTRQVGETYPGNYVTLYTGGKWRESFPIGVVNGRRLRFQRNTDATMLFPRLPLILDSIVDDRIIAGHADIYVDLARNINPSHYIHGVTVSADGKYVFVVVYTPDLIYYWTIVDGDGNIVKTGGIPNLDDFSFGFGNQSAGSNASSMMERNLKHIWSFIHVDYSWVLLYKIDDNNDLRLVNQIQTPSAGYMHTIHADNGIAFIQSRTVHLSYRRNFGIVATTTPVRNVVGDICRRAGMPSALIDVGTIGDPMHGYIISRQMSARQAIEPLQQAYYFDAVESGGKLKFVKRGGPSVATLDTADLAAHEYGSARPDELRITRQPEQDLPAAVNVIYSNKDNDYQQGTQQSKRMTVGSKQSMTVEVPIVMDDNRARQMAEVLMYDAWTQRTRYALSVSRKHAALEPTDVITVTRGGAGHTLRITRKEESRTGVIRLEAVAEQAPVYTQTYTGGASLPPSQGISIEGPTKLHLLDIQTLRDEDNDQGFYAAAAGYTAGWPGCVIYRSIDGGMSYTEVREILTAATMGMMRTALGPYFGGNTFDEINTAEVDLLSGQLSSTTMLAVLNGANAALIGNEIVQFRDAVLVGANRYRLSGLLRGRLGTEWAMGSHAVNERFVLLDANAIRRLRSSGDIGLERKYKAVTIGTTLQSTPEQSYTYTGVNLRPLAPVHLGGGRVGGDLTIRWIRRTRVGGVWRDLVDAQLGEASEAYEIEIWTSGFGALRRTLTSATNSVVYTAAMQTADFGGVQSAVHVRVYQMSAAIGRGYVLQGVV